MVVLALFQAFFNFLFGWRSRLFNPEITEFWKILGVVGEVGFGFNLVLMVFFDFLDVHMKVCWLFTYVQSYLVQSICVIAHRFMNVFLTILSFRFIMDRRSRWLAKRSHFYSWGRWFLWFVTWRLIGFLFFRKLCTIWGWISYFKNISWCYFI